MYSIASGSAFRAAVLYGLFAVPYLHAPLVEATAVSPLQHRAPQVTTPPSATAQAPAVTAVSKCHLHGNEQYCQVGTTEFRVSGAAATASSYTNCHAHGAETWCNAPTGEVRIFLAAEETGHAATPTPTGDAAAATSITAVTGCHLHGSELLCLAGETEYRVHTTVTKTQDIPPAFTGCHAHDEETFCVSPNGDDVEITLATEDSHDDSEGGKSPGLNCHFHAGVEHCVSESGEEIEKTCERVQRDYNIKLRVGLLFVMLATSSIGVFTPILISSFVSPKHVAFTILRQFGTGVIISTAFVHLYTHAVLMFQNECLGKLSYEATASAILMAGIFLSFLIEYAGSRLVEWQQSKERVRSLETASDSDGHAHSSTPRTDMVNIAVLESGIIFHSLLIGLTLVVAGDSFFGTLFAVIVFHQMFEGIALGTRIASLGRPGSSSAHGGIHGHGHGPGHGHFHHEPPKPEPVITAASNNNNSNNNATNGTPSPELKGTVRDESSGNESDGTPAVGESTPHISMRKKLLLALAFAVVTPIGMAIGIGALHQFNGNDPSTIIAIGTLDAFSAGILVWVGVVEMWAHDWMLGGEMTKSGPLRTMLGLTALVAGMAIMSLLGKWA